MMSYVVAAAADRRKTATMITPTTANATAAAAQATPMMSGQLGGSSVTGEEVVPGEVPVSPGLVAVVVSIQHNTRFAITRQLTEPLAWRLATDRSLALLVHSIS